MDGLLRRADRGSYLGLDAALVTDNVGKFARVKGLREENRLTG